jgi:hypothetical protein
MDLCCSQLHVLKQSLEICGGATESIFPEVETMLFAGTKYQKALKYIARFKDMKRYRSVIDFLFCELHTEFRKKCFKFYDEEGPALKETLTLEEIDIYGKKLIFAIEVAYKQFKKDKEIIRNWSVYKGYLFEEMKKAS